MNARLAAPVLALILAACGGGGSSSTPVEMEDVTMTFFRSFGVGSYVFRSQAELASAWAAAPFRVYPIGLVTQEPAMPTYDFSQRTVVGLSLGVGKWCFKPIFTTAVSNGSDLVVHYTARTWGTLACMFDSPQIVFALVPRVEGVVEFVRDDG